MRTRAPATPADRVDVEVGRRVKLRRKQLGLSQGALAEHLSVSFQQVQKYERGANRISASMLVRIAAALDTRVSHLVGEDGDEARLDSDVLALLAAPGAPELLDAYSALGSSRLRAAVLNLAEVLAGVRASA